MAGETATEAAGVGIGFRRGRILDPQRRAWGESGSAFEPRPLVWTAWYPALGDAVAPLRARFFREAPRLPRAEPLPAEGGRGLVLLSHGTGGAAEGLGWLAERLVRAGHIVIGVDHHGNTASEPYRAEGFLAWWERARDLSVLLDHHLGEGPFAALIDPRRIHAAGFSMGGYSVLAAMGAVTEFDRYRIWAAGTRFAEGPREFPDLPQRFEEVMATSRALRESWARQSEDYRDPRIRSALLCAPAPTVRAFRPETVAAITAPVGIIVGGNDHEAPAEHCADWLMQLLPRARLVRLGAAVGHHVFMNECTPLGRERVPHLCVDAPGVDRAAIHDQAAALALEIFGHPVE